MSKTEKYVVSVDTNLLVWVMNLYPSEKDPDLDLEAKIFLDEFLANLSSLNICFLVSEVVRNELELDFRSVKGDGNKGKALLSFLKRLQKQNMLRSSEDFSFLTKSKKEREFLAAKRREINRWNSFATNASLIAEKEILSKEETIKLINIYSELVNSTPLTCNPSDHEDIIRQMREEIESYEDPQKNSSPPDTTSFAKQKLKEEGYAQHQIDEVVINKRLNDFVTKDDNRVKTSLFGDKDVEDKLRHDQNDQQRSSEFCNENYGIDFLQMDKAQWNILDAGKGEHPLSKEELESRCFRASNLEDFLVKIEALIEEKGKRPPQD